MFKSCTCYVFVWSFLCPRGSQIPWFMRPPLRCGECWTGWAVPLAPGRNAWSEATASRTLLWSAAGRPAAPRGQRSPREGLRLHLRTKVYTIYIWTKYAYLESLSFEDLKAKAWISSWVTEAKQKVKTYSDWAFHCCVIAVLLVHKTLYGTEGHLSVSSSIHLHWSSSVWRRDE